MLKSLLRFRRYIHVNCNGLVTGSATRKPRPEGGDKGRNKKLATSLPGSPALWAGSFTEGRYPEEEPGEHGSIKWKMNS